MTNGPSNDRLDQIEAVLFQRGAIEGQISEWQDQMDLQQQRTQTDGLILGSYMFGLPPSELKLQFEKVKPETWEDLRVQWKAIGKSLDSFFGNSEKPDLSHLPEKTQKIINEKVSGWLQLSIAIFEGEQFIKEEFKARGLLYTFKSRSKLLKALAWEECVYILSFFSQDCRQMHSGAQIKERLQEASKVLTDQDYTTPIRRQERFDQEDQKLQKEDLTPILFLRNIVLYALIKNKEFIPSFNSLMCTVLKADLEAGKYAVVNQEVKKSRGRGKGKTKNEVS